MPDPRLRVQVFVAVAVVAAALLGGAWYGSRPPRLPPAAEVISDTAPAAAAGTAGIITVHVAGAVVKPGLVAIPDGSRIADAVAAAGGALPFADLGALNLAAPVRESDRVEVPVVGASGSAGDEGSGDRGVDLNRASAAELEALPGVGPVLAARIVAHREANGPFASVEDLLDVPGIGEAKLAALRDGVATP